MPKKSITVNLEPSQLNDLAILQQVTGIENQQVHIRLAMRQYLARESEKLNELEKAGAIKVLRTRGEWLPV